MIRSLKPVLMIIAIVLSLAVMLGVLASGKIKNFFEPHQDIARVTLRNFTPGSQVNYRVLSDAKVISKEQVHVDEQGTLSLPIDKSVLGGNKEKQKTVKYELDVAKPAALRKEKTNTTASNENSDQHPAELLNLMLALNPVDGEIDFSVKGLDEFEGVILKKNNKEKQPLSADWAGVFKTTLGNPKNLEETNPEVYDKIQLAFQSAGIQSDLQLDETGMPVVEVQALLGAILGTGSRNKETGHWGGPFHMMTEQFSAVMTQQTMMAGMFIDASIQLETQRKLQELQARAHKDYHPSEQMCRVGSYVRSVAHTESKAELEKIFLNKYLINQYTAIVNSAAAGGPNVYEPVKVQSFVDNYCDTADNGSATEAICDAVINGTPAATLERMNKDIDYTRMVETKLTLDIDFANLTSDPDEEDVLAMARYLYFPAAYNVPKKIALDNDIRSHYESRSYAAKMGVAHNSFINIIGMRASAPAGQPRTTTATSPTAAPFGTGPANNTTLLTTRPAPTPAAMPEDAGWAYMKAMFREIRTIDPATNTEVSMTPTEIDEILGERPSYYAQMEVLTKKIYQNPNFYTNLYDKPANVKRIGAMMDAILLMNQRDRFESLLRREMLTATLIENVLYDKVIEVNAGMFEEMQNSQLEFD